MAKVRNWLAVRAHFRSGAGSHGDGRKAVSRGTCRGSFDLRDYEDEFLEDDDEDEEDILEEESDPDACKTHEDVVE